VASQLIHRLQYLSAKRLYPCISFFVEPNRCRAKAHAA
jgi:hypothetical protein